MQILTSETRGGKTVKITQPGKQIGFSLFAVEKIMFVRNH